VQEKHERRRFTAGVEQATAIQTVIAKPGRDFIIQGLGKQLAQPLDCVLTAGNRVCTIIKTCSQWLACRVLVQPHDGCSDVAGQPGAFQQTLGIDYQIIVGVAQALLELTPLAILDRLPEILAPAANGYRNHSGHRTARIASVSAGRV